jgi:TPP-dependent pyruvate/acetoin dehydrogenase alpha subunit
MPIVFWFSRLQPGVDAAAYERWVREADYVAAKAIPAIISYRVYRIHGPCLGDDSAPYDYVEVVEVTDLDDYRRDIEQHPAARPIVAEIGHYVQSTGNAWGIPLSD